MPVRNKAKERAKQPDKTQYRVSNWPGYNRSLVHRGSLTLWINEQVLSSWRYAGGQVVYKDVAIECLLALAIFQLPLRATQDLAQSHFEIMGLELPVPNYTAFSRRAVDLVIKLPSKARRSAEPSSKHSQSECQGPLHLVLDSSSLKTYGEGKWRIRKHGKRGCRSWRKLHLAVDGAYDKRKVYTWAVEQGIHRFAIPPQKRARSCKKPALIKGENHPRDQTLAWISRVRRRKWKRASAYYRQSVVENSIFRFKTIFGPSLRSRKIARQITETSIKCVMLNRMAQLGMPDSYPVLSG